MSLYCKQQNKQFCMLQTTTIKQQKLLSYFWRFLLPDKFKNQLCQLLWGKNCEDIYWSFMLSLSIAIFIKLGLPVNLMGMDLQM